MKRLNAKQTNASMRALRTERPLAEAFGFIDPATHLRYHFHQHRCDQLLVPLRGVITVETSAELLAAGPSLAIWIPAGTRHATSLQHAQTANVMFDPVRFCSPCKDVTVFAASKVIGAMAEYAADECPARLRETFFATLHGLCEEAMRKPLTIGLPRPKSPGLMAVSEALVQNLSSPNFPGLPRIAGKSSRTLRRAFQEETGLSLRGYLHRARMISAMRRLSGDGTSTILEIGLEVGFNSPSAFAQAFAAFTGMSPREFQLQHSTKSGR